MPNKNSQSRNNNSGFSDSLRFQHKIWENCTGMFPFFLNQFNPYSCSVASVVIVLNTIISRINKDKVIQPVDQHEVLQKVDAVNWRERVSTRGFEGRHGLTVIELGIVVEATLNTYKVPFRKLKIVPIHKNLKNLGKEKDRLFSMLTSYCQDKNHYIIAHFTQGVFTGEYFGGHISPIGAFDPVGSRVLILDVDKDTENPYWVPFELFFEGLVGEVKTMGPKGGGYVSIFV